jgi:hypothetical protein
MTGFNGHPDPSAVPDLARVSFFDGQRLAAFDLNAAATLQRELRWLHNRSLHGWGIGLGFTVSGAKGDTQVSVGPGYAIDCLGREIVLTESLARAVPARAHDGQGRPLLYYLVAAYPDDSRLTVLEQRTGECETEGAVRLRERAAIYWKSAREGTVEQGFEIVLARASVLNCELAAPLSLDQRRSARPHQQPMVAAGATGRGSTGWQLWTVAGPEGSQVAGVRVDVETSAARFGVTPHYQAQLRGLRTKELLERESVLDGMTLVSGASRHGFSFHVLMPADMQTIGGVPVNPSFGALTGEVLEFARDEWWVEWVGVEG